MTTGSVKNGTIDYLAPAAVIKEYFQRRATGECTFSNPRGRKSVYFKNGIVVYSSSTFRDDRLGDVLLQKGIISQPQYDLSSHQVAETKKKQGTLLVQMGALTPKGLFNGLNIQVREIIHSLLPWDEGSWEFNDRLPPQGEIVTLRIQPAPLILEGAINKLSREDRFRKYWAPLLPSLQISPDPPWALDDLRLPPQAGKILTAIEEGTAPPEAATRAGMTEEDAAALLYVLFLFDMLLTSAKAPPREAVPEEVRAEQADELPSEKALEKLHGKIGHYNLYQVLRLEPGAGREAIKSAYIALAKEYHPDRFFENRYDSLRDRINAIFMKINEAYSTLSNPGKKAEYDMTTIKMEGRAKEREDPERDSRIAAEQFRKAMDLLNADDSWAAVESFRWAVHLNPRSPLYHSWLGAALTKTKKRLHEAEEHCKTAIALDYSNPLFYVHLGEVYRTGKLLNKAKKQFETALRLDPSFAPAKEAIGSLAANGSEGKGLMNRIFKK